MQKIIATNLDFAGALPGEGGKLLQLAECHPDLPVDDLLLILPDILGVGYIGELDKYVEIIRNMPLAAICHLVGIGTHLRDDNWEKYREDARDRSIRNFVDAVLERGPAIGVRGQYAWRWLIEYFGYGADRIIQITDDYDRSNKMPLQNFINATWPGCPFPVEALFEAQLKYIPESVWHSQLASEVRYWRTVIEGTHPRKEFHENVIQRAQGGEIAPVHLHKYLDGDPAILDVGAGPASVLGGIFKGRKLNVTACDPLAHAYASLFQKAGIEVENQPMFAVGESLPDYVSGTFDFVYSRNALDHGQEPLRAIQHMVDLCNPGGIVFIENCINEGLHNNYEGLHRWNFMAASNDLVIWDQSGNGRLLSQELKANSFKNLKVFPIRPRWICVEIIAQ